MLSFLMVLAILFFCGIYIYWGNNTLAVHEETISVPALPEEFDGLRIAHLSDLHGKEFGKGNIRLLTAVSNAQPDLIFITGDLIDQASQFEILPELAEGLAAIAPTYYVTGNHEWAVRHVPELKKLLGEHGIRVLTNEYELWNRNGAVLAIAGVDDPNGPADQKTGTELCQEIQADCTLLLTHRDNVEEYASWGYDVVFCGHGHGGIFRIPIIDRGLLSTKRTFFPKYDGGAYTLGENYTCYVSRGLGNNTVPIHAFRLFNRPDLPIITLRTSA